MSNGWIDRWRNNRIGWHEPEGNRSLKKHWSATGRRVLVPLCGKSYDLIWLQAQGNDVVGIELSEIAARAFFDENQLDYRRNNADPHRFDAVDRNISIICGDYFDISVSPCDACFDRGALVAMSPDLRTRYVKHTKSLLADDPYQLLITLEYDQTVANGPPFSVPENDVRSYWPNLDRLDAYEDLENCPPKFREAGLESVVEVVWRSSTHG